MTLTDEKDPHWASEVGSALVPDFGNPINTSVSGARAALRPPKSLTGEADPQPQ